MPALLFEWPLLMCEVLCIAAPFFALCVCAHPEIPAVLARARTVVRCAAVAAVLWMTPALLYDTAQIAGIPIAGALPLVSAVLTQTHAGRLWVIRIGLYAAMAGVAWKLHAPRSSLAAAGTTAATLMLLRAMGSHAIDHGSAAVAAYWAHEIAASAWFGSLAGLALGLRGMQPASEARLLRATAPRVSRTAGWCVATLLVTGGYASWYSLGFDLGHLLYSAFGRTLLVKLAIASGAILLGGYNRRYLLPRLSEPGAGDELVRNVTAESCVLIVVLACSSVLAATPPAH